MYALTVTVCNPVLVYVCVGLVVVTVSEFPSPQVMSYLFALPTAVIDNVIVSPDDMLTELDVNVTLFTYVLLRMFSIVSFNESIASVTFVVGVSPVNDPSPNVESVGVDNSCVIPFMEDPELDSAATESSIYFLCAASSSAVGVATCNLAKFTDDRSVLVDPSLVVVPTLNLFLTSSQ